MVEIRFSHSNVLDQAKVSLVIFPERLEFCNHVIVTIFDQENRPNPSRQFRISTLLVQLSLSKEAVMLWAVGFGRWDRTLIAGGSDLFLMRKPMEWWRCTLFLKYSSFSVSSRDRSLIFHCHVIFQFLICFYKVNYYLVFQIFLFEKHINSQMAAVMLQVMPSFYANHFKKQSFYFCKHMWKKNNVCKEYSVAQHDDKLRFVNNCRYHIILIRDIDELLRKWDAFCFTHQHVDCLFTLFKYFKQRNNCCQECLIKCKEQSSPTKET